MIVRDKDHLQSLITRDTVKHTLVLVNQRLGVSVYGQYVAGEVSPLSLATVKSLFDDTFDALRWSNKELHAAGDLPLIRSVGPYQNTLITKHLDGSVTVVDATQTPIDAYMGVERG